MKYLVIFVLIAAIGGGGFVVLKKKRLAAERASTNVPTEEVARRDVEKVVSANGAVSSNRDVDIKCQASGFIDKLPYTDVSEVVKPGEMVCHIDEVDEKRLLDTANAVVAGQKARIQADQYAVQQATLALQTTQEIDEVNVASDTVAAAQTKAKAERTKSLFEQKLESQEDVDTDGAAAAAAEAKLKNDQVAIEELKQQQIDLETKKTTVVEDQAALAQNQSQADTAKQNVEYCTVTAPPDDNPQDSPHWVISSLLTNIATGYLVQSGASGFSAGTTIMTLSDLSHIFVLADVDESDIGQVQDPSLTHVEQKCRVTVDAYPGVEFDGVVKRVAPKGVNTSNVVTFEVKVEVTSANRMLLRPLMTATAKIISESHPDVLAIPVSAFMRAAPPEASDDPAATAPAAASADSTTAATSTAGTAPASNSAGRRGGRTKHASSADVVASAQPAADAPQNGTVTVVGSNGQQETRDVTVGLNDGDYYEVISGLQEGEMVETNRSGGASKWMGQTQGRPPAPRISVR